MVWLNLMQHLTLVDVASWHQGQGLLSGAGYWDWSYLAAVFNTDVFAATRNFFNGFVKSGQIWALAIGLVVGYVVRGLTTYG
ncbi:MAG: hypothetical protein HY785_20475 [Oscillatoriophycideae cyanobacterium NC_groundwater_1537_Pr4_S-0.65um_50_18]|nr:hypothetical protein [Oscillatoriophycideae cyanobacterium NC_groundwater_1537_Pr4_S-0.65um_50_18]